MAGIAKPNIEKLGKEAKYKVISFSGAGGGTVENFGLFDGKTPNEWDTPRIFYWYYANDYLELDILSYNVNIWRCGTVSWVHRNSPLIIQKWNGNEYIDVTDNYKQTTTKIDNTQWEETISGLPKGRYKFLIESSEPYRIDSEWYIEEVQNYKYLLKQNDNYFSINNNYMDLGTIDNNEELDNLIDEYGYDDLSIITKELDNKKIPTELENDYYKSFDINLNDIKDNINLIEEDDKKYIECSCNNYKISDKVKEINNAKFEVLMKE